MSPPGNAMARIALGTALAACVAAVFWLSNAVAPWDGDRNNMWHHYEYLAEGFLRGHTYLPVEPAPELLSLKDPYDPAANARSRLWDASLFRGKYYLYFGPGPAVALMIPWRIATGHMLPQRMAVGVFAAAGLAALARLIWGVRRRHFPGLSGFATGAILFVAFHAAWLPVVLRRPGVWELPIVSAAACLWWALYFLWRFRDSGGRTGWAVALGASLALLLGCRITHVFGAVLILLLLLAPFGGAPPGERRRWKAAFLAAALVCAAAIALLLYNWNRFGSWLEFGQSYQLAGSEVRGVRFYNPSYLAFNLWTYLLALPEFGPYFPFLHGAWPDRFPEGYVMYEAMYGALFVMPVHLAGLAALAWAFRSRSEPSARATAITIAAAAGSTVFAGAVLFCWQAACSRYIAELFAGWTVATALGLMVVFGSDGARRFGRAARVLAAAAACWTIACVCLASAEFRGFMRQTNPGTYAVLAHALDYPSQWWIQDHGIRFGPEDVVVRIPPSSPRAETVLLATGFPEKANQLILDRLDEGHVRLVLSWNQDSVLETPPLAVPAGRLRLRLSAPWLYPPPDHPYWDRYRDSSQRLGLQTLFSLDLAHGAYSVHSDRFFDAAGFEPAVQVDPGPETRSPYVESIRRAAGLP
jgi:hypothetical protein